MNPERSTEHPSALSLLNIVQRGSTAQWRELYQRCRREPGVARELADILPMRDPDLLSSARLWKAWANNDKAAPGCGESIKGWSKIFAPFHHRSNTDSETTTIPVTIAQANINEKSAP